MYAAYLQNELRMVNDRDFDVLLRVVEIMTKIFLELTYFSLKSIYP